MAFEGKNIQRVDIVTDNKTIEQFHHSNILETLGLFEIQIGLGPIGLYKIEKEKFINTIL